MASASRPDPTVDPRRRACPAQAAASDLRPWSIAATRLKRCQLRRGGTGTCGASRGVRPHRATTPAYPFHHLQSDGLWVVTTPDGTSAGSAVRKLRAGAVGALDADFEAALRGDPGLAGLVARTVLDHEFPESLHADICATAGRTSKPSKSAPLICEWASWWRGVVIRCSGNEFSSCTSTAARCAASTAPSGGMPSASMQHTSSGGRSRARQRGQRPVPVCASPQALGPWGDGCGCRPHRDGLAKVRRRAAVGRTLVLDLAGRPLGHPQSGEPPPHDEHIQWHVEQVFHGPARAAS